MTGARSAALLFVTGAALLATACAVDVQSFFTVGNWGDDTATQAAVAAAMGRVGASLHPNFVVSTGDNFLPAGVVSSTDSRFTTTWANVYNASSLAVPWHVVLGDRDHATAGSAVDEVNFSHPRWKSGTSAAAGDARFFKSVSFTLGATVNALFVFVDTTALLSAADGTPRDALYQWVADQLATCPAGAATGNCLWLFVVGHHPLYSAGEHPLEPALQERLLPLLQQYSVDAYFSSHDASLQHFTASRLELFVAGSAGGATTGAIQLSGANTANWYPPVSASGAIGSSPLRFASLAHGFSAHVLSTEALNTTFYDASGSVLYNTAAYPRRAFGPGGNTPVSAGEKVVLAMCWVFVLAISLAIAAKSYLQKRADEMAAKQAKAAQRVSSGGGGGGHSSSADHLGSGSLSAIAIAGDGKFEQMAVVSSAGPTVDSKAEL